MIEVRGLTKRFGETLAVGRVAPPLHRQMRGLEELRAGEEGDAGHAEDVHGPEPLVS